MQRLEPSYPSGARSTLYSEGVEFQDFVCAELAKYGIILQNFSSKRFQLACGENIQGFEIKLDKRCHETGRLSIEIAEKSNAANPDWVPSGIYRNDNCWLYIQGNHHQLFIFPKNRLIHFHERQRPEEFESYGTVRKFYVYLNMAALLAAKVIDISQVQP